MHVYLTMKTKLISPILKLYAHVHLVLLQFPRFFFAQSPKGQYLKRAHLRIIDIIVI